MTLDSLLSWKQTNFNTYNVYVYQFRPVRRKRSFVGERSLSCPVMGRRWQWCYRYVWYIRFVHGLAARSGCSFRSGCRSGTVSGYCWQFSRGFSCSFMSGCSPSLYNNTDGLSSSKMKTRWTGGLFHSARFTYDTGWKISPEGTHVVYAQWAYVWSLNYWCGYWSVVYLLNCFVVIELTKRKTVDNFRVLLALVLFIFFCILTKKRQDGLKWRQG